MPSITADHLECIGVKAGKKHLLISGVMPKSLGNPALVDLLRQSAFLQRRGARQYLLDTSSWPGIWFRESCPRSSPA